MDENTPEPLALPQTGGAWVRLPDGRLVREGEEGEQPGEHPAADPAQPDAAEGEPA